jgi:hypothetical protein
MKRTDGGKGLSDEQAKWFKRLKEQNYLCYEARGCDEAWAVLCWYLEINRGR